MLFIDVSCCFCILDYLCLVILALCWAFYYKFIDRTNFLPFDEGTLPWEDGHICLPDTLMLLPIWDHLRIKFEASDSLDTLFFQSVVWFCIRVSSCHFILILRIALFVWGQFLLESLLWGAQQWLLFPLPFETLQGQLIFFCISNCFQNKDSFHIHLSSGFPFAP